MVITAQYRPKILMVTARFLPYMGGIETHVHEVGSRLAQRGINITILTTMPHGQSAFLPEEEVIEGMQVVRVPAWPRNRDYYLAPKIAAIIKQGNWDLVHCQGCHTFVPPLAMLAAKQAGLPYIVTFHTGGHSSSIRSKIRDTQWRLQRTLLAGASRLVGVSRFEADYFRHLLQLPKEQFAVVYNGATMPIMPSEPEMSSQQTLIISIGRLERYKGHQHIIAALPEIRKWRSDARLLILGKGPYEAELRTLAQKRGVDEWVTISSIPPGDRTEMAKILSQAALVTLLSDYEAHPIAVMEALALRRPVLTTDSSGFKELAEQGWVRVVPMHCSASDIARAVQLQIESPLMPSAELALPTWDDCTEQLLEIYCSVIKSEVSVI
jgi:glycosyltransferase involved in cell wall biosynthesis